MLEFDISYVAFRFDQTKTFSQSYLPSSLFWRQFYVYYKLIFVNYHIYVEGTSRYAAEVTKFCSQFIVIILWKAKYNERPMPLAPLIVIV